MDEFELIVTFKLIFITLTLSDFNQKHGLLNFVNYFHVRFGFNYFHEIINTLDMLIGVETFSLKY